MRRALLVFVLLAGAGAMIGVEAAAAKAVPCSARPGTTVLANPVARVFTRRSGVYSTTTYVCDVASRRVRSLGDGETTVTKAILRLKSLSGHFFAFVYEKGERGGATRIVSVVDIRTGRGRAFEQPAQRRNQSGEDPPVTALTITAAGSVAWIVGTGPETPGVYEVHAVPVGGTDTVLSSGDAVESRSLAAARGVVYWSEGGAPRRADLP